MAAQFHWNPETYLELIRAEVPRYDELQEAAIEAIPFGPDRVLELGIGTGETTRASARALPASARSPASTRAPRWSSARASWVRGVRLARMEDPLPDGPWDLVIAVLSVHHLDDEGSATCSAGCASTRGRW